MDRTFNKLLLTLSFSFYASVVSAQAGGSSPGGTAAAAIEGLDVKEKRGLTFLPGVRSTVTYSDNLNQGASGSANGGFRTEISPYVFASINNDKGVGQAYLSLRNFYQSSAPSGFYTNRIDFRGNGTFDLYNRWLFLESSGFAYNVSPLTFGSAAFDSASVPTFNYRFQGYNLAPYIRGNWGSFAEYKAQYSHGFSEITGFASSRTDQRLIGNVSSGSQFNRWGWSWDGLSQTRKIQGSPISYGRQTSTATAYIYPTEGLRLGASIRYEQIDTLFNKAGKDNGFGPGASIDWTPSTRTGIRGSVFKQYYGTTGQLGITHRLERLSFNLAYDKAVITGNDASFLNIDPQSLFSAGGYAATLNPIYRSLVANALYGSYGVPIGLGVVNDAYVLRQGGSAGVSYLLANGTISAIYSDLTRETLIRTYDPALGGLSVTGSAVAANGVFIGLVKTQALTLDWDYKLDSRSRWNNRIIFSDNHFPSQLRGSKRAQYQSTFSTRITPDTTASFGLRRTEQIGTGFNSTSFDENSVFSTLDVRF
jgi:uncharacterized protein (PEP-CTERM system associated)